VGRWHGRWPRGVGMAVDRVWSGYLRILGMWVVGVVQIFAHGFVDLDIRNTVGLWWILYFAADIHWSSEILIPINPHKNSNHIRNIIIVVSFLLNLLIYNPLNM
jgi:hypothetical protein